eukprot:scaffold288592_cov15-Tisochrysis_lutea.AAC.1
MRNVAVKRLAVVACVQGLPKALNVHPPGCVKNMPGLHMLTMSNPTSTPSRWNSDSVSSYQRSSRSTGLPYITVASSCLVLRHARLVCMQHVSYHSPLQPGQACSAAQGDAKAVSMQPCMYHMM